MSTVSARVWRVYVYFVTLPNASVSITAAGASGSDDYGVVFNVSDSKLYAGKIAGDTISTGASGVSVTTNTFYRLDVSVDFSNNPRLVNAKVDGVTLGQYSDALAATTTAQLNVEVFRTSSFTADVYWHAILVSDTLGDYPLGPGFVDHFVPTSDGTHNIAGTGDFQRGNTGVDILNATTTAWQLVDDVPLPSGTVDQADCQRGVAPANPTTDYVHGVFGPASGIPTPTRGPRAVEVILVHHQISTATGQMEVRLDDNGTVSTIFNTGAAAGVTTYRYARAHFATPPTGGSWTASGTSGNFNLVGFRFLAQDANPDQCLDAIMIEAEFIDDGLNGIWRPSMPDVLPVVNNVVASGMTPGRNA